MPDFCRFCAEQLSFDWFSKSLQVSHRYFSMYELFKEYIDINDTLLPKTACEACYDAYKKTKAFFNTVKQSQILLTEIYKQKELQLLANNKEPECNTQTLSLQTDNLGKSIDQHKALSTAVITPPHTQNATLITEKNVNKKHQTDCFVQLVELESNSAGMHDSSISNEMESCIKYDNDESILLNNITSNDIENNGCHLVKNIMETLVVKEDYDSETETSVNSRGSDYTDGQIMSLIVNNTMSVENIDSEVNKNCSPLFQISLMEVDRELSLRTTNASWTSYKWSCCHCETVFENLSELRAHSRGAHNICSSFKCTDCNKQYHVFNSFVEHVRQHREGLRYYCEFCNQRFEDTNNLKRHVAKHINGQKEFCDCCGQTFDNRLLFAQHVMIYKPPQGEDKDRTCKLEKMQVQHCSLLKHKNSTLHSQIHEVNRKMTFTCNTCNKSFSSLYKYNQHMEIHNVNRKRPFTCNVCNKSYYGRHSLRKHMEVHDANRKNEITSGIRCSVCNKYLYLVSSLKRHMKTHDKNI